MTRKTKVLGALAGLGCVMALSCGSNRTAVGHGTGGVSGTGGVVSGTGTGSGGTTSTIPATGTGGTAVVGTGGSVVGGSGTGGNGTAVVGTGGNGVGGIGTGGRPAGTGGAGTGGTMPLDAGCTGSACVFDGGTLDGGLEGCSALTSTECNLRNDCHSVYVNLQICACMEEGCCMRFDHCADGDLADCTGPAICNTASPVCEGQNYTVGFKGGCYEGCVRTNECILPACPQTPPSNDASCGPVDHPCFYEDCAGKGRTLATCKGGTWTVQTTACAPADCVGVGVSPLGLTCAEGQVCVRTNMSYPVFTVEPSCVDNTCGAQPIAPECLTGLSGTCSVEVSASGGDIYCVLPSGCQGAGGCAGATSP